MIENQDLEILKYQKDKAILDLCLLSSVNSDTQIIQALKSLIENPVNDLIIQGNEMTERQAQKVFDFISAHQQVTFNVTLPKHLKNTKIQIELDNLISNHRLEKNSQTIRKIIPQTQSLTPKKTKGRILPKGKITPRIEITLHEVLYTDQIPASATNLDNISTIKPTGNLPKLERSPLAARVINEIMSLPNQTINRPKWAALKNRNEAQEFRKNLGSQFNKKNHPLPELIKKNSKLRQQFTTWNTKLKFDKEQYDALLDVYGQYGASGLTQLFTTWDEYAHDTYKGPAFLETYTALLKYMPTYLPFIEDKEFQETITKIANLSQAHRSWWMALIQNHGKKSGYDNLAALFKQFTNTVNTIEQMGLTFYEIKTIKNTNDLLSTLTELLDLLNKCSPQDQATQWQCINNITFLKPNHFHFIIPEMQMETHLGEKGELEWIKTLLKQEQNSNPKVIEPTFYRYIATQKHHLPLEQYKKIITELYRNSELNNEVKIHLIYILAKTTSTNTKEGFDANAVFSEWEHFKTMIIKLDSIERLADNRNHVTKIAFLSAINVQGGYPRLRIETLKPIMEMSVTPPMSYLNKLLKLSEYKFLDPNLNVFQLQTVQTEMMKKINEAALLYKAHPESIMHAIRLIKTETVKKNKNGSYEPEAQDITLLEQFINACEVLTTSEVNPVNLPELKPQKVLLPLLTVFHLEYENKNRLINEVIKPYKKRLTNPKNALYQNKIQNLLPYGLSLLQLIQNREQPKLDYKELNKIQDNLISLICHSKSITKKEIREWMHKEYGQHFNGTILLDIKDTVDFSSLFKELDCNQKEICSSIELLVSHFDNEEEKDQHEALVRSLVSLEKTLTPIQKTRFFGYWQEEFKTNGLLSRNQHPGPPSYLTQFKMLIDSITKNNLYDAFEQYMSIAQEYQTKNSNVTNHLEKCRYLLDTLYPKLIKQGASYKEAFHFGAKLVCFSSLNSLYTNYEKVNIPTPVSYPKELTQLQKSIADLVHHDTEHDDPLKKLKNLQENINKIIKRSMNNKEQFKECRAISTRITEIITAIKDRTEKQKNNKNTFQSILNFFLGPSHYIPVITQEEQNSLIELDLLKLTEKGSNTYNELQAIKKEKNQRFQNIAFHLHAKKIELIKKYSNIATRTNDFISTALKLSSNNVTKNHNDTCQLIDNLIALDDQNLVLSLMYHYAGGLPNRDVKNLIELFNTQIYKTLPRNLQKDFINTVITQMNNSVKCNTADIYKLLRFIHQHKENKLITQCLHDYYQQAPFPPVSTFIDWIQTENAETTTFISKIQEKYQKFDKNPCATGNHNGREIENGFKLYRAQKTLKTIPETQRIFTKKYLYSIQYEQLNARNLPTQEILKQLKEFKNKPPKNHVKMVMLTAELLHRCKGRPPEFVGQDQIPGRSYELNTTQIIAILSLLETGHKVTAEVGTGEGKTRIMMILNACQFLQGKTVDYLTSNLALAERDYLESLPFFNSLGAEVNFITASSKIEDYKMGGINVSDPENLCLFRNKAFSQNKSNQVLNEDPKQRALMLDEADVTYFDVANLKYNYSSTIPKINIELLPLFPLLMDFFAQSDTEKIYLANKQRCNEQLLSFIEIRNHNLFQIIKSIPVSDLERWQDAAYIARHLEYDVDYQVTTDATIPTALGNKKVAAAMCRIRSRRNEHANFADGVHQCLHAELNRLMKIQNPNIANPSLKEALEQCKIKHRVFNIEPIKKITFSSSSNTLLKAYNQGSLHAVTATIGLKMEQKEAQSEFGTQFIRIPKHRDTNRFDRPTRITQNEEKQLDTLVAHILESTAKNQPILLVCKEDNESKILHDKLEKRLAQKQNEGHLPKLTRIHAGTDPITEANHIKNDAGKPGQITITTDMEGRGVDIELKDKAHHAGLKVLLTYLPHGARHYRQIIGRSGRYGAIGETQMILNLEALKKDFGINKLNTNFYLNPEDFIGKLQIFATHTNELRRLFHRACDNYFFYFSEHYEKYKTQDHDLTPAWSEFLERYNYSQDRALQAIEAQLEQDNPNIRFINEQLMKHSKKAQKLWHQFTEQLPQDKKETAQQLPIQDLKKPELLEQWLRELQQIQQAFVIIEDIQKVRVQKYYDPTAAGSVQITQNPTLIKGTLSDISAAWRGEGILFPNFRAWWVGKLSFSNFLSQLPLFRWLINPKEEAHIIKKTVPSMHAILLYQNNQKKNSVNNKNDHEMAIPTITSASKDDEAELTKITSESKPSNNQYSLLRFFNTPTVLASKALSKCKTTLSKHI